MLQVSNGNVKNYIEMAINSLFNNDDKLSNEYDYRTYEALERALTYQTSKDVNER